MIIVDTALRTREEQDRPIRVGMIGAGFMGQGLTNQIVNSVPGMRMAAVQNRHLEKALHVYRYAGCEEIVIAESQNAVDDAISRGVPVVTEDPFLIARSGPIDVLIDVTGSVEFGARVTLEAFAHGKPVVLMNAELDATIGPILQVYARKHGDTLGLRRGRTGRADEPRSVGQGARLDPAPDRKRQRSTRPLPKPDHSERLGRPVGSESGDGDVVRRRLEDQL